MKAYTIQLELLEGSDEFWEGNPTPADILREIKQELDTSGFTISDIKITKIVDDTEYSQ